LKITSRLKSTITASQGSSRKAAIWRVVSKLDSNRLRLIIAADHVWSVISIALLKCRKIWVKSDLKTQAGRTGAEKGNREAIKEFMGSGEAESGGMGKAMDSHITHERMEMGREVQSLDRFLEFLDDSTVLQMVISVGPRTRAMKRFSLSFSGS
jgi:hypothetical protein